MNHQTNDHPTNDHPTNDRHLIPKPRDGVRATKDNEDSHVLTGPSNKGKPKDQGTPSASKDQGTPTSASKDQGTETFARRRRRRRRGTQSLLA